MGIFALASLMGDLTGSLCLCPSEVVKQKVQAGLFHSEKEALSSIWKAKGFFGFYEGYMGGLVRDIPFRVAQLVSHFIFGCLFSAHVYSLDSHLFLFSLTPVSSNILDDV